MKVIILATGPSLTTEILEEVRHNQVTQGIKVYGMNLIYNVYPWLDVFHACNPDFYDYYWYKGLREHKAQKWTWDAKTALKYDLCHVEGKWADGLSTDPDFIHYHHASSPQLLNLAYHHGAKEIGLLGFDMRYPGKINDHNYTDKRHYFGEYPKELQHWPRTGPDGEMTGLIKEFETIKPEDYGIEIYNLTKNSALKCYPFKTVGEFFYGQ